MEIFPLWQICYEWLVLKTCQHVGAAITTFGDFNSLCDKSWKTLPGLSLVTALFHSHKSLTALKIQFISLDSWDSFSSYILI